jgi:hypothetical protein
MFIDFQASSLLPLLEGLTQPALLPFYGSLVAAGDPAVHAFLHSPGGFGTMPDFYRRQLFSFLFSGTAGPLSTQYAMVLREAYLSAFGICRSPFPSVTSLRPRSSWRIRRLGPKSMRPRFPLADTKTIRHIDGPI